MINNLYDFDSLGLLDEIKLAILEKGYKNPTEIQINAIPEILKDRDLIAVSQTGSGKTASFTLPLIQKLVTNRKKKNGSARSLILVPTRELANQVGQNIQSYSKNLSLKIVTILGGVNLNPQIQALQGGVDILIATPGRLLDLYEKGAIKLDLVETLVLDEADKLLDLGFKDELNNIFKLLPKNRQNLLFSATFPESIRFLSEKILVDPVDIRINKEETTAANITEWLYPVDKTMKNKLIVRLLEENNWNKVLIFANSQNRVDRLSKYLESQNIHSETIHGDKTQSAREFTLGRFRSGTTKILIATDIASRGIDIKSLPVVINFDLPNVATNYIHRVGRTGRAGESGIAISFGTAEDFEYLIKIERQIQCFIQRKIIPGFEVIAQLPESPKIKPLKVKKKKIK